MGYQYVHLESYARKADSAGRSTDFVFAEACRKKEASIHVAEPLPPVVVYGVDVEAAQEIHDAAAAEATIVVKGGHTRKVARDKKTLHTVVASYPATMDEVRADPVKRQEAEEWEKRTVAWLRSQYGPDLKSVIRHEDEMYYHIHAYVVPTSDPALSALKHHPGVKAKRAVMEDGKRGEDRKALSKRADAAYKAAMRAWQDSYHNAVGIPCGLTRLGPQRRRLSRAEWKREQVQAQALKNTVDKAQAVKAAGANFISATKAEADKITDNATKEREAAREATTTALAEQNRAAEERSRARRMLVEAARYSGWAGRIRALWDGFRKSSIARKIRADLAADIQLWQDAAEDARRKQREAEKQRHLAEQRAREAQHAALEARVERDRLRSITAVADVVELQAPPEAKLTLQPPFRNGPRKGRA